MKLFINGCRELFNSSPRVLSDDELSKQLTTQFYKSKVFSIGDTWRHNTSSRKEGVIIGFSRSGIPLLESYLGEIYALLDSHEWNKFSAITYYVYFCNSLKELVLTRDKRSDFIHKFTVDENNMTLKG